MSEREENGMEQDVIVFESDDGQEFAFTVEDYFFYNGEEYALLAEVADEEEEAAEPDEGIGCIICKVISEENEDGEEEETFEPVEDEDLAQKLFEIATTRMKEDEEE